MNDHLKFWHCDYCHKGLTASQLHDITDHKVRCWSCYEKQEAQKPIPEPFTERCLICGTEFPEWLESCPECGN